jgi:dTDP-4-dehydrorhamnose 3,5-epimerase
MKFLPTPIIGAYVIEPEPLTDDRGWFMRTYCREEFAQIGHRVEWVQMNQSFTREPGTVRGFHFQAPPHAEIKTVRCIAGAVFDVIVDIRKNSPTFLQWFARELSASNRKTMYIPMGVAHGFQALEADSQLVYCHSAAYDKQSEAAIRFDDPAVGVHWPLPVVNISPRDSSYSMLAPDFKGIEV